MFADRLVSMRSVVTWGSWHLKSQASWPFVNQLRNPTQFLNKICEYEYMFANFWICYKNSEQLSVFRPAVFLPFKTFNIGPTTHEHYGVLTHQLLDCLFNLSIYTDLINENSKHLVV